MGHGSDYRIGGTSPTVHAKCYAGYCDPLASMAMRIRQRLYGRRVVEYLKFDASLFRLCVAAYGLAASAFLRWIGKVDLAIPIECSLHSGALGGWADRAIESRVQTALSASPRVYRDYLGRLPLPAEARRFYDDPERLLGRRILVAKSPDGLEKGVIHIDYSFVFSLMPRLFDIDKIMSRYYLVLEPSWSGYCSPDILSLAGLPEPVFVEAPEPRDASFLRAVAPSLIPIATASNWWIDHRIFRPLPDVQRDMDVLFNASWAGFKRHDMFFRAVAHLRKAGRRLRVLLVGYGPDAILNQIVRCAEGLGIRDQIEVHKQVAPDEVNRLLNRVKVNVVWSRREGCNRAIIEGFAAGVPGILRAAFNYGFAYPYINKLTGSFASEDELPDVLVRIIENFDGYDPRAWVLDHMTPQIATGIVDDAIAEYAARSGQPWRKGRLAVKVKGLGSMAYWEPADRDRFQGDYTFLRSALL